MPQFLIDRNDVKDETAILTGPEAKHLVRVLRHKCGDEVWLSDGAIRYKATIQSISSKTVQLKIVARQTLPSVLQPPPTLAIALLKHDHLEWVLEKSVELGVHQFYLLLTERTIPHYQTGTTPKKTDRFLKIAAAAAKQSGFVGLPKIEGPIPFSDFTLQFPQFSQILMAQETTPSRLHDVFERENAKRVLLLIGPEGGWTPSEIDSAEQAGAKRVGLGPQILRSETAAITAIALCQYELRNLG